MDLQSYIILIRSYLNDTKGKIWGDDELGGMIEHAVEEYSSDTCLYRDSFYFSVDNEGNGKLPDDYIKMICGWNNNGDAVLFSNRESVEAEYGKGTDAPVRYIYEDTDSIGRYTLSPNPYSIQSKKTIIPENMNGVIVMSGYGTVLDYGIPVSAETFCYIGDAVYARKAGMEEVEDYQTIIYHVLYQAFTESTEFQDTERAALYQSMYKSRVARTNQMKPPMVRKQINFY